MRLRGAALAIVVCAAASLPLIQFAGAQTPTQTKAPARAPSRPSTTAAAPKVYANLAQVMRGILFPSSNVIFYAQSKDPAEVKPAADPTMATDPLENSYGGWAAVENSSLALAEAANLLTIPGRLCSNGRPVPVNSPEWAKFVQALRDAGMTAYKSAQAKNQDKVLDASDAVTQACYNCHNRYREKAGGIADRCM